MQANITPQVIQPDSQRIRHACCDICSPLCNCGNVECSDFVMEGLNDHEDF